MRIIKANRVQHSKSQRLTHAMSYYLVVNGVFYVESINTEVKYLSND
jgi:hypothetical protein